MLDSLKEAQVYMGLDQRISAKSINNSNNPSDAHQSGHNIILGDDESSSTLLEVISWSCWMISTILATIFCHLPSHHQHLSNIIR